MGSIPNFYVAFPMPATYLFLRLAGRLGELVRVSFVFTFLRGRRPPPSLCHGNSLCFGTKLAVDRLCFAAGSGAGASSRASASADVGVGFVVAIYKCFFPFQTKCTLFFSSLERLHSRERRPLGVKFFRSCVIDSSVMSCRLSFFVSILVLCFFST